MNTKPVSEAEWDAIEAFANEARVDIEEPPIMNVFQSALLLMVLFYGGIALLMWILR